ncbi:MAG: carboxylate-amine ligase, partial [Pseudomonadota bacterium]
MAAEPDFTIGVEEEYLLVDQADYALREAPQALMDACAARLEGQFSPEFLQCQVEIGTAVCATVGEAREDLKRLRSTVAEEAAKFGLAPIAASCHPFADWKDQHHTDRDRYHDLERALGGVARRLLICGMHVHVGLNDDDLRVDLMPQVAYFLPHLLAASGSSPYWQGRDTGLSSYRLTVFDNLPRTGLPPQMSSWSEYQRTVGTLVDLEIIEDSSKIWWDLRPSHSYPTLESRICDTCPRLEDALTIAAATQAIMRMLWRLKTSNQRWRTYDRFLVAENRWRAQRYVMSEGLIDFGRREIVPYADLAEELVDLIAEDAGVLRSSEEVEGLDRIAATGASADRQRAVFAEAKASGADGGEALRRVTAHLVEEFRY